MRWPWTISKPSGVIAMHERLVDVFTSNGLITAFAAVGLLMLVCNLVSKHLTGGRIHGSAIAIAAGLVLSYIGGVATGGEDGVMTREGTLDIYWQIGLIAIAVGIVVILISGLVKRLMHLDTLQDDDVGDDLLGQSEGPGEPQGAGIHPETRPNS